MNEDQMTFEELMESQRRADKTIRTWAVESEGLHRVMEAMETGTVKEDARKPVNYEKNPRSLEEENEVMEVAYMVCKARFDQVSLGGSKKPVALHWHELAEKMQGWERQLKGENRWPWKVTDIEGCRRCIQYAASPERWLNGRPKLLRVKPGFYMVNPAALDAETKTKAEAIYAEVMKERNLLVAESVA